MVLETLVNSDRNSYLICTLISSRVNSEAANLNSFLRINLADAVIHFIY